MTSLEQFKQTQREGWSVFGPLEAITTEPASNLVKFAGVERGRKVLDVGCGTGVVAVTAALLGAEVSGIDICPTLLERANENSKIAGVVVSYKEGDVEELPYPDESFDFVLSQFGHMFAPRPEIATSEMLRVLKKGGTIAFSTWPPHLFTGMMFKLVSKHLPPPEGVSPPPLWGDPNIIRERLGDRVENIVFDEQCLLSPSLSPGHSVLKFETTAGPLVKLKEKLEVEDPKKLEEFRSEFRALVSHYRRGNTVYQHFLMTRAQKVK